MKSSKLKRVWSGVSALTVASLMAGQALAAPVYRFVGNGDFAEAWPNDGTSCGYVYVSRGGAANSPETYLFYLLYDCGSGVVSQSGYGMIPNANLQGDGAGRLSLTTDTSGANFTRDVGGGGAFAVTWAKTLDYSSKWAGSSQTTYHDNTGYSYHATGSGQNNSAAFSGTILGYAVSATAAGMGQNNSVQLVIERGP